MADVTAQLVDPTMLELSGVTTGANVTQFGGAQGWIVMKGATSPTIEGATVPGATDTTTTATAAAKDATAAPAVTTAADPGTGTAADAPTVDVAALQAELESTKAALAEATKGKNPFADDDEDEDEKTEKALAGISDEGTRNVIRKALAAAAEDRVRVEKMLDAERTRDAEAIAARLSHLPTGDKFVSIAKALGELPEWPEVVRILDAAEAAVAKAAADSGAVTGAHRSGGDAAEKIEAIAKGLLAGGTHTTIEQARAAAYQANPDLVAALRADA